MSGTIGIYGVATFDVQGHNLIANDIELGTDGSGLGWSLLNRGADYYGHAGRGQRDARPDVRRLDREPEPRYRRRRRSGSKRELRRDFLRQRRATFDAQGYGLTANDIELGTASNPGGWTLLHQGQITAAILNVYGGPTLAFGSGDSVTNLGAYAGAFGDDIGGRQPDRDHQSRWDRDHVAARLSQALRSTRPDDGGLLNAHGNDMEPTRSS